jgi:hypothetical protein
MQHHFDNVQDQYGNAIGGVSVLVSLSSDGSRATIYSDNGVTATTNPLTTAPNGSFDFYAANGNYTLTVTHPDGTTSDAYVSLFDVTDVGSVANDLANINAVANAIPSITTVNSNLTNITTVAGISGDVTAVAGVSDNVTTVAGISGAVSTTANNITAIQGAAGNAASAATSQSAAATNAASALNSANVATAAAQSSGAVNFYNTKALANAALAGLADQSVVEVFADESLSGRNTRYRKESGALNFKLYLDTEGREFFVDSVNGSDSNSGYTSTAPFQSITRLLQETIRNYSTIYLASGSRWFVSLAQLYTLSNATTKRYGNGAKPILDGSRAIPAGSWTPDGTYPNVYYADVTHDVMTSCTGVAATTCHFMCWQEAPGMDQAMTAKFDGGTIAANRAWVSSNAGSFCCNQQGSTVADPRTDTNSKLYRYYVHLTGDVDPRNGTVTIYHGEQTQVMTLGAGCNAYGLMFKRTSGKDMTGVAASGTRVGTIKHCEWVDSAVHGWVGAYAHMQDVRAITSLPSSVTFGGGGFHAYYGAVNLAAMSPGILLEDFYVEGFTHGVYWHGADLVTPIHRRADIRRGSVRSCTNVVSGDLTLDGIFVEDVNGFNTNAFLNMNAAITATLPATRIKRCRWVSQTSGGGAFNMAAGDVYVEDFEGIGRNSSAKLAVNAGALQLNNATELNLYLTRVTSNGLKGSDDNARKRQIHLTCVDSTLGQLVPASSFTSGQAYDSIVATNTQLAIGWKTLAQIQAIFPGVDNTCVVPYVNQPQTRTILSSDMAYVSTARTASATSGSTTLTLSFADSYIGVLGTAIQVVNYDGAGTNFNTVVTGWTGTGSPITVSDLAPATFSGKAVNVGTYGKQVFPQSAGTCVISNDGTQIYVSNEEYFTVGQTIYIGGINHRSTPNPGTPVARQITAKSGQTLTMSTPIVWMNQGSTLTPAYSAFGSTSGVQRPSFTVSFGFPLEPRTSVASITRNKAGSNVTNTAESASNTALFTDSTAQVGSRDATGTTNTEAGRILHELGYMNIGFRVAPGDVLSVTSTAYVEDYSAKFSSDPTVTGEANLVNGSLLATLRMGAQFVR